MAMRKAAPKGYEHHPTTPGMIRKIPSPEDAYRKLRGLLTDAERGAVSPLGGLAKPKEKAK